MHQNFSACHAAAKQKMAQIPYMLQLFIIGNVSFFKISMNAGENRRHIRMHQLAVKSIQYIIGASFLVKPQGKRSVFIFISK